MKRMSIVCMCGIVLSAALVFLSPAQTVQVGAGSYYTAGNFAVPDHGPNITSDFSQKIISAKWWATMINYQFSWQMWAHPLCYQTTAKGLDIGYPGAATGSSAGYIATWVKHLSVGVEGMTVDSSKVASYSHFGVTARWQKDGQLMEATMNQGIPFTFFKISGGNATVTFASAPTIWYNQGGVVGATVAGKYFALFAPTGAAWTGTTTLASSLAGKDYLSVAVLPDNSQQTLSFFKQYAYSFVKNTRVSWNYDEASAMLTTTFSVVTDVKEGLENGTLFAMKRHQWLSSSAALTPYAFQSAHGLMKVTAGQSFSTDMKFNGVLTVMPDTGYDKATLAALVKAENPPAILIGSTYNKEYGKFAQLAPIADMVGDTAQRNAILKCLRLGMEKWFTCSNECKYYYHKPWSRLIGYPAAFFSDTRLADHHFHAGYTIHPAQIIAQYNPAWGKKENFGGMVEMVMRDINAWDDNDSLFGRFGYFEPYEGHGWADGIGNGDGNNEESSSESMNFNAGLILWGVMTGNKVLRDEGIFMYVNEARAVEQYWWDVDHVTFPSTYPHVVVGMVKSNGGGWGTWFSGETGAIHGINLLPNTAGHLYYGRCPDYIPVNYTAGAFQWLDLFAEYLAYADGAGAMQKYNAGLPVETGNSKPACYLEISSLNAVGRLDTQVVANTPTFGVFTKSTTRTYCAFNPDSTQRTVTFNDGFSMVVPPRKQICKSGPARPVSIAHDRRAAMKQVHDCGTRVVIFDKGNFQGLRQGVKAIEVFDLAGKKVWASGGIRGSHPGVLTRGLYIVKTYE
jgi:endoglucanase Acf2